MVNQHESPFYQADAIACKRAHKRIVESFPISRVYQVHIPTYPSGHWLFGFASKKYHPIHDLNGAAWKLLGIDTRYYTPKVHQEPFTFRLMWRSFCAAWREEKLPCKFSFVGR